MVGLICNSEIFLIYGIVITYSTHMTYELSIQECKGLASEVLYYLLLREDMMDVIRIRFKGYWRREERKVSVKVILEEEGVSECRGLPIDQWNFRFKG